MTPDIRLRAQSIKRAHCTADIDCLSDIQSPEWRQLTKKREKK